MKNLTHKFFLINEYLSLFIWKRNNFGKCTDRYQAAPAPPSTDAWLGGLT